MSSVYDRHDLSESMPKVYDSKDAASSVQDYMFIIIGVCNTVRRPRNLLRSRCVRAARPAHTRHQIARRLSYLTRDFVNCPRHSCQVPLRSARWPFA